MWYELPQKQKELYKQLITNFASLSEAFAQKKENDEEKVAPIVNSKFQETVFQRSFSAVGEDIANSSYDASIKTDKGNKYLVGIKAFGINSGDQKIAQFKADSAAGDWGEIFKKISENMKHSSTKEEADEKNKDFYMLLAKKIARLRNKRISSSEAQLRGFDVLDGDNVEAVYHVLMPSKRGSIPKIFVGETSYSTIDEKNLKIYGATSVKNPKNFKFSDGIHDYKYTSADSQLLMSFHNKSIIVDEWDVNYVQDAFEVLRNLGNYNITEKEEQPIESYSWIMYGKNGEMPANSGFNAWDGKSKLGKEQAKRQFKVFSEQIIKEGNTEKTRKLVDMLQHVMFDKPLDKSLRKKLLEKLSQFDQELYKKVQGSILRPIDELYIPLPNSRKFNEKHPDFFGKNAGLLASDHKKMAYPVEERKFLLKFMPSGEVMEAFIGQDTGKGIESYSDQAIMGRWILQGVFQLNEREPLTREKLNDLHINGIRVKKFEDEKRPVELEFIWLDRNNLPEDIIGWAAKSKK